MKNINNQTLITIAVFTLLFISIGWAAPIMYVSTAPDGHFIEMHSFEVEDTHVDADSHEICFNRTVHRPSEADITVEMLMVREDGAIVEKDSFEVDAYYQKGTNEVIVTREIRTDNLEPGTYQYIESSELHYYDGRATKTITFKSEKFRVYESKEDVKENGTGGC